MRSSNIILRYFFRKLSIGVALIPIILLSGHVLQSVYSDINLIVLATGASGILYYLRRLGRGKLDSKMVIMLLLSAMCFCTMAVYFGEGYKTYISFLCMAVTGYVISEKYSFRKMVILFQRIMTIVTFTSMIGYYLVNNSDMLDFLPKVTNINEVEFGIGVIFNYITTMKQRNCGMFWEPGIFATYLSLALIFELLFTTKVNWFRLFLFSVGIFTANSAAGFVLWFLCVLLMFVRNIRGKYGPVKMGIIYVVLLVAVILVFNFDLILAATPLKDNTYFQKLSTERIINSFRFLALSHNMGLFLKHPVFGAGAVTVAQKMVNFADTSTTTYLLSIYGVLGSVYTICWIIGILKIKGANVFVKSLLLLIVMIILNKEPHHQLLFSWCLMFYLWDGVKTGQYASRAERTVI